MNDAACSPTTLNTRLSDPVAARSTFINPESGQSSEEIERYITVPIRDP